MIVQLVWGEGGRAALHGWECCHNRGLGRSNGLSEIMSLIEADCNR